MRLFTLGPRLETAAAFIPQGAMVADIGTDHARLPIWLIKTGRCARVIASDIADVPVQRARENAARWGLTAQIEILQCAGFDGIDPERFTCGVICGMGGDTIAGILENALWTRDPRYTLVLQPETSAPRLRAFLYTHGYTICRETAVLDAGRVYAVMQVRGGEDPHRDDPLYVRASAPLLTQRDEAARRYMLRVRHSLEHEMQGMEPDSDIYAQSAGLLARLLEWETDYAQGI